MNSSARAALMQLIEQAAANAANKQAIPVPPSSAASMALTEELRSASAARAQEGRSVAELRPRAAVQLCHDMTVAEAAKRMTKANADAALIIGEDDRVDGIFTDRDLATRVLGPGLDPRRTRVGAVMTESPQCVMDDEPALSAISLMIEGGFRHVPVVDATESVVGLLDVAKCLHDAISSVELGQLEGGQRTVRELLASRHGRSPPVTISPSATIHAAAKRMSSRRDIPALLVAPARRPGRSCAGILTPKDLLTRVVGVGASAGWVKVESVMTPDPAMVEDGATLLTALHLLQGSGFRHLPVVSSADSTAVGVLDVLTLLEGALLKVDPTLPTPLHEGGGGVKDNQKTALQGGCKGDRTPPSQRGGAAASAAGEYYTSAAASPPFGTPLAPGFFLFKVSVPVPGGDDRLLRLRCAGNSLRDLLTAVTAKIRPGDRVVSLCGRIDDATELMALRTDSDLSGAVASARAVGKDRLLVTASLCNPASAEAPAGIVRKLFPPDRAARAHRAVQVSVVAAAVIAATVLMMHARH
mmetsp:Transcript_34978/g.111354  ORF Transcript_34978/g.111354 Transcript_34978/m.111354 type:complete len:529 (-) Transcript_34978:242-1828(-)